MKISNILIEWYKNYARDLPWRNTKDPYKIWISEIILQQTQVRQGTNYYIRFVEHFPDVYSLSAANEEEVLKLWQGLGYYSRARNLLFAAKQVISEFNGQLPDNFNQLKTLKGIGDYTAAAIASIAFNEPVAAVDGNVSRVLSRLFGIDIPINSNEGKKTIQKLADDLLNKYSPGNSNQALMEFGALVCKPANPKCETCPLRELCRSFSDGTTNQIPVKISQKGSRLRWFNYFLISQGDKLFLEKRNNDDIWKALFQFPLLETKTETSNEQLIEEFMRSMLPGVRNFTLSSASDPITHLLTHQTIKAKFFQIKLHEKNINTPDDWYRIDWIELDKYPIPRLIDKYLESL